MRCYLGAARHRFFASTDAEEKQFDASAVPVTIEEMKTLHVGGGKEPYQNIQEKGKPTKLQQRVLDAVGDSFDEVKPVGKVLAGNLSGRREERALKKNHEANAFRFGLGVLARRGHQLYAVSTHENTNGSGSTPHSWHKTKRRKAIAKVAAFNAAYGARRLGGIGARTALLTPYGSGSSEPLDWLEKDLYARFGSHETQVQLLSTADTDDELVQKLAQWTGPTAAPSDPPPALGEPGGVPVSFKPSFAATDDLRTDTLIVLCGSNGMPNLLAARLLLKEKGQIVVVYTPESAEVARHLQTLLHKNGLQGATPVWGVPLADAQDPAQAREAMAQALERADSLGGTLGLHFTGGTKPMAVEAFKAVRTHDPDAVCTYLDPTNQEMRTPHRQGGRGWRLLRQAG